MKTIKSIISSDIKHNERICCPRALASVRELATFVQKLDEIYHVDSNDRENSFMCLDLDKPLVSHMYDDNIFFFLNGYDSDIYHVPKYQKVPQTELEGVILFDTRELSPIGVVQNPYRDQQVPIEIKQHHLNQLVSLRQKAIAEITEHLPKRAKKSDNLEFKDYDVVLQAQGFMPDTRLKRSYRNVKVQDNVKGKTGTFQLEYYRLGSNFAPHFTTFFRGSQFQEYMNEDEPAYQFWKKWGIFHLTGMTQDEYNEMLEDVVILDRHY